jgi:NADH:ubiquinone oxidoreductase subunit 6 (subunit J)
MDAIYLLFFCGLVVATFLFVVMCDRLDERSRPRERK